MSLTHATKSNHISKSPGGISKDAANTNTPFMLKQPDQSNDYNFSGVAGTQLMNNQMTNIGF